MGYYELTVETSNQPSLSVGSTYSLHINMSYAIASPYYGPDDGYISFEIRNRASSLERQTAPVPTPYLDMIPFTVYYSDVDDGSTIGWQEIDVVVPFDVRVVCQEPGKGCGEIGRGGVDICWQRCCLWHQRQALSCVGCRAGWRLGVC